MADKVKFGSMRKRIFLKSVFPTLPVMKKQPSTTP